MRARFVLVVSVAAGCLWSLTSPLGSPAAHAADAKAAPTYAADVQSILNTSCVNCHNPSKKKAGVDLQSLTSVLKTVKPGDPNASRLYKSLVGAKGTKAMPPKKRLPADQVDVVKAWIAGGAKEK